jgi:hypothetical protein
MLKRQRSHAFGISGASLAAVSRRARSRAETSLSADEDTAHLTTLIGFDPFAMMSIPLAQRSGMIIAVDQKKIDAAE